jgi:hypothetical protein
MIVIIYDTHIIKRKKNNMTEDGVLVVVTAITTTLLFISEMLGLSNCKANAILELYKNFACTQHPHESEVATSTTLDTAGEAVVSRI